MASSTKTDTEARKTSQAARRTGEQAKKTTDQAEATTEQAGRTAQALLTDSVYAAVGSVDQAVSLVRSLRSQAPRTVQQRRKQLSGLVDKAGTRARSLVTPGEMRQRVDGLTSDVAGEFDELASRGRGVVRSISRNRATRNALDQTSAARSQLKGAVTSIRKAAGLSMEAADTAGEKLGRDKGEPSSSQGGGSSQRRSAAGKSTGSKSTGSKSGGSQSSASKSGGGQSSASKSGGGQSGGGQGSASSTGGQGSNAERSDTGSTQS